MVWDRLIRKLGWLFFFFSLFFDLRCESFLFCEICEFVKYCRFNEGFWTRKKDWMGFSFFLRRIKIICFDWRKNDLRKKKSARYRLWISWFVGRRFDYKIRLFFHISKKHHQGKLMILSHIRRIHVPRVWDNNCYAIVIYISRILRTANWFTRD